MQDTGGKKILYFIENSNPTAEDFAAAKELGTRMFRNAGAHFEGDTIEACDGVAGCAPDEYRKRFPVVDGEYQAYVKSQKEKAHIDAIEKAKADAAAAEEKAKVEAEKAKAAAAGQTAAPWATGAGK